MFGLLSRTQTPYRRIDAREFDAMRKKLRSLVVIDVREPFELKAFGQIPGIINIPLGDLARSGPKLPKDRSTPIVVVCQSGNRSQRGAAILAKMGYTDLASLDGGTMGWLRSH